ncbi:hypothetical protein DKX38_007773 [Salix brachista]|uniref:Myb-like domain-containing protein n=2 Tax=Salix TaxID=40685 RepID=A0A5N5MP44_9ROSI|nr:hypothetical protein DKX38_007773 [Salix brachista]
MKSSSFRQPSSNWTAEQHKLFENALAKYDKDTADRWRTIAKLVGETTEEEVKRRYDILLEDLKSIESDKVPLPNYKNEGSRRGNMSSEEERPDAVLRLICCSKVSYSDLINLHHILNFLPFRIQKRTLYLRKSNGISSFPQPNSKYWPAEKNKLLETAPPIYDISTRRK